MKIVLQNSGSFYWMFFSWNVSWDILDLLAVLHVNFLFYFCLLKTQLLCLLMDLLWHVCHLKIRNLVKCKIDFFKKGL